MSKKNRFKKSLLQRKKWSKIEMLRYVRDLPKMLEEKLKEKNVIK